MGNGDFALKGTLSLDSKQFRQSTKQAQESTTKFSDKAAGDFEALGKAGKLAFAGMVAAAAVWTKNAVGLAVTAEETVSKFNTVTGASADLADGLLEDANKYGTTRTELQGVVATLSAVGQGFGFAQAESVEFATETVELAGDLASFNNVAGGAAEVAEILTSAYAGEREQLKRLGIVITQADVDTRALTQTNKDSAKQLTASEKAAATYSLVVERAGVAVGDLNRTSESTANQQRAVAAAFREVQEEAGKKLIPALNTLLEIGTDALPLFATVMGEIVELLAGFITGIETAGAVVGDLPEPMLAATAAAAGLKVALLAMSAHPVIAGLVLLAATVALVGKEANERAAAIQSVTDAVVEMQGAVTATQVEELFPGLSEALEAAGVTMEEVTQAINEGGDAYDDLRDKLDGNPFSRFVGGSNVAVEVLDGLAEGAQAGRDALEEQAEAARVADRALHDAELASAAMAGTNYEQATSSEVAAAAQEALTAALQEYVDTQLAAINPVLGQIKATEDLATAQAALAETELEFGAGSDAAVDASLAVISAQAELDEANAKVIASGVDATETFRELGNRAELSGVQLQGVVGAVRDVNDEAEEFQGDYQADFAADTTPAQRALAEWQEQAAAEVVATVEAVISVSSFSAGGGSRTRGFAAGTASAPAGLALVGEQGTELVDLNGGERIFNATDTASILAAMSGGRGDTIIKATIDARGASSPQRTERAVVRGMSKALKQFDAGQRRPY